MKQVDDRKGNTQSFIFTECRLLNQETFMLVCVEINSRREVQAQSLEMWNVKPIPKNGATKLQCFWTWLN